MKKATAIVGAGIAAAGIFLLIRGAQAKPPPPPPGLANLYGRVTDAETGNPVSGVLVNLNGLSLSTDSNGDYLFEELDPGSYSISFSKEGYETIS